MADDYSIPGDMVPPLSEEPEDDLVPCKSCTGVSEEEFHWCTCHARTDGVWKRPELMTTSHQKHYRSGHVYIFDDVPRDRAPTAFTKTRAQYLHHADNNELIRKFFEAYTNYTVHSIYIAGDNRNADETYRKQLCAKWKDELARLTEDDFAFVYFQGKTEGIGKCFTWKFHSQPRSVNAYELFEQAAATRVDCMFLMDGNFTNQTHHVPARVCGHSDYISSAYLVDYENGGYNIEHSFTSITVEKLQDVATSKDPFAKESRTLLELLSSCKSRKTKPIHEFRTEASTERGAGYPVYRFSLDPDHTAAHHSFEFFRVQTQGRCAGVPRGHPDAKVPPSDKDLPVRTCPNCAGRQESSSPPPLNKDDDNGKQEYTLKRSFESDNTDEPSKKPRTMATPTESLFLESNSLNNDEQSSSIIDQI